MSNSQNQNPRIVFWGLGYIGFSGMIYYLNENVECFGIDNNTNLIRLIETDSYKTDLMKWIGVKASSVLKNPKCHICTIDDLPHDDSILSHHICIPTEHNGNPDLVPLFNVLESIITFESHCNRKQVAVVIESTLIPGSARDALLYLKNNLPKKEILFCIAPRRDWFGYPEMNLKQLNRVYGTNTISADLFFSSELSIVCENLVKASNYELAELTKSVENAFRHMDITLANQLCDAFPHIDMREVLNLVGTKWNVNTYFPSFGTGGYCIPLSSKYIIAAANKTIGLLEETIRFDSIRPDYIANKIISNAPKRVGILGVTYKEDIKVDKNCAISVIIKRLLENSIEIYVNDCCFSQAEVLEKYAVGWFDYQDYSSYQLFDALIIFSAHSQYYSLCPDKLTASLINCKYIYDNTGIIEDLGIASNYQGYYYLVGRGEQQ